MLGKFFYLEKSLFKTNCEKVGMAYSQSYGLKCVITHFMLEESMKKIGVISAVLDDPLRTNQKFNDIVSDFQGIIRGRMGIPFMEEHISVVSLTVCGDLDEINELTGKLGNVDGVTVKTAISKKTL